MQARQGPTDVSLTSKFQPEPFNGEMDSSWMNWADVFRAWIGQYSNGRMAVWLKKVEEERDRAANAEDVKLYGGLDDPIEQIGGTVPRIRPFLTW